MGRSQPICILNQLTHTNTLTGQAAIRTTPRPLSLSLRLRRICSGYELFEKRAHELHNILLERGYKDRLVRDSISKARQLTSEVLRTDIDKRNTKRVPPVVTYNPALLNIRKLINSHQQMLSTSLRCKEVFCEPPMIAYRKGRNLMQVLTTSATSHRGFSSVQ